MHLALLFSTVVFQLLLVQGCKDKSGSCSGHKRMKRAGTMWGELDRKLEWVKTNLNTEKCGVPDIALNNIGPQGDEVTKSIYTQSINKRVVGGGPAKRWAWPWQAMLLKNRSIICGGSIIKKRWILTAAHCFYNGANRIKDADLDVRVGDTNWKVIEGSEQDSRIDEVFIHKGYDPKSKTYLNDIALIKLRTPIKYGRYVKPICLPKNKLRMDITTSTSCYITGWGLNVTYNGVSKYLKQAMLPPVTLTECNRKRKKGKPALSNRYLCAGDGQHHGDGACDGDSGGPYVCNHNGIWEIHGVISFVTKKKCWDGKEWISCKCLPEKYTKLANVHYFRSWIKSRTTRNYK